MILIILTACSVNKSKRNEPIIIEKSANVYVTIPNSLLVKNCAEPAVLSHGDTVQDLIAVVNINRNGIEKCKNVIDAIINYNNEAKLKSKR